MEDDIILEQLDIHQAETEPQHITKSTQIPNNKLNPNNKLGGLHQCQHDIIL